MCAFPFIPGKLGVPERLEKIHLWSARLSAIKFETKTHDYVPNKKKDLAKKKKTNNATEVNAHY